jgi:hypothetical protein
MKVDESVIRDKLAENLDILEEGLTLEKTEKFLPNPEGTRSFVDILARDKNGKYVLIELKKTNAAARQAIHEILKYIEGVKLNLGLKEDELRILIVSTEWKELLIPFSSLANRVHFRLAGIQLTVDGSGNPTHASRVTPAPVRSDRLFSSQHHLIRYRSLENLENGTEQYIASCAAKGIKDYVLIQLSAAQGRPELDRRKKYEKLTKLFEQLGPARTYDDYIKRVPLMPYMLYFAMVELDLEYCLQQLEMLLEGVDAEEWRGTLKYTKNNDELLHLAHEQIMAAPPEVPNDDHEMGYPAKFADKLFHDEWEITDIFKFGALAHNDLLVKETLVSELCGDQGNTRQHYKKTLSGEDTRYLATTREEIRKCLIHNPQWTEQINRTFVEIEKQNNINKISVYIFNPNHILLSLYKTLTSEDEANFLPHFSIQVDTQTTTTEYIGRLTDTHKTPSMKSIVNNHFEGKIVNLLAPLNWGGLDENDAFIVRSSGLSYETYSRTIEAGTERCKKLTSLGFEECIPEEYKGTLSEYSSRNADFLSDIIGIYSKHWDGTIVTYDQNDEYHFLT